MSGGSEPQALPAAGADEAFDRLGEAALELLRGHPEEFGEALRPEALPLPPSIPGLPDFVLESETGLLLGSPPARSLSLALPVRSLNSEESLAWTFGDSLADAAAACAPGNFLQILLIEVAEPVSRILLSRIFSLRSLIGRLPGYLAHSVESETTARLHRGLVEAGLGQAHLARAQFDQLRSLGFVGKACVALGLPSLRGIRLFAPLWDELRRLRSGLAASRPSEVGGISAGIAGGCSRGSCQSCDERIVCDRIRIALAARASHTAKRGVT